MREIFRAEINLFLTFQVKVGDNTEKFPGDQNPIHC